MADTTSQTPRVNDPEGAPSEQATDVPIRLLRGNASPAELSEVVAAVMVLTTADSEDDNPDEADGPSQSRGRNVRSLWSSPSRMVRTTAPRGPGGWRASAAPR
ncbi:MAG: hypothetical protein QOE58_3229 [Actinomycetota bacterium]|jgi:hypothetical protein|nr:hypothetical protein [Actinomycetota bacterium]